MSYRALVTINGVEPHSIPRRMIVKSYLVLLGEDWDDAAVVATILGKCPDILSAMNLISNGIMPYTQNMAYRHFDESIARQEWIDTYADQKWVVDFTKDRGDVHRVQGWDAEDEPIRYGSVK